VGPSNKRTFGTLMALIYDASSSVQLLWSTPVVRLVICGSVLQEGTCLMKRAFMNPGK